MRYFSRILLPLVLLLAFTGVPAFAQTKIATVDLKKLFENYYKTKLATAAIQERADELDKEYVNYAADLKKRSDEYQTLLESANDQAVSQDERDRRKQDADAQLTQLEQSKATIEQFERQAQVQISDQKQRMRDNIMADIQKFVTARAKSEGDTLVLDSAAQTINGTPAVVFDAGSNDLTDAVLKDLNASAPPDLPDTTSPPPVYLSTNGPPMGELPDSSAPPATSPISQ